jgi:hypothetical protein
MLGKFTAQGHEGVSVFPASKRQAKKCHLWQGRWVCGVLSSLRLVRHAPSQLWLALRAAVLRLAVRALSAAEYGTAALACMRSPAVPSATWHLRGALETPRLSTRDAQPFHREDSPRQAGASLSCQTLGVTVARSILERTVPSIHALGSASAMPLFVSRCLASSPRRGNEGVSLFRASRRLRQEKPSWQGRWFHGRLAVARTCSARSQSVVVGAPRRSAAPGSQFMGAAGYGSSGRRLVVRSAPLAAGASGLIVQPVLWLAIPAMPNPSIERTRPGKPGRASHVKR